MPSVLDLLREDRTEELWQKCCGFIDLNIDEFMDIQKRLLLEQIELLKKCELGNKVMRGAKPRSVEEFLKKVPITTYDDYAPYLPERIENALPEKPKLWQRTSGRSAGHTFKWVPITERLYQEIGDAFLGLFLLASCKERGDVVLEEHDKTLYALAPPPYASGCWVQRAAEENIFDFMPPIAEAESMTFEERIQEGFKMGLSEGISVLAAMTGVLVAVGEQFGQGWGLKRTLSMASRPKLLPRLAKAMIKSKLARRPMLPKDMWSLKGLMGFGAETAIYREKIKNMWGRYPLDLYGSTEGMIMAMQTWDYEGMTFLPHVNFLEFMPEKEYHKWAEDPIYQPDTLLLSDVKAGENYAIIITNFYGGALVRYFLGDLIKITSLRNERLNINLPQMLFDSRVDGIIDIDGCLHMTERIFWQALENSGLVYQDWVVRQEEGEAKPRIHFYIEPKNGLAIDTSQAADAITKQLSELHPIYAGLEDMSRVSLEVSLMPKGAFGAYMMKQRAAGADLAHLKPPHVNPSGDIVDFLLNPVSLS